MTQVLPQSGVNIIEEAIFGERERMSNLTILKALPRDAGAYVCTAENVNSDASASAVLTVHGRFCISWLEGFIPSITLYYITLFPCSFSNHHFPNEW